MLEHVVAPSALPRRVADRSLPRPGVRAVVATRTSRFLLLTLALLGWGPGGLALLGGAGIARGQAPDVRNIRPVVMLLVDTSGSMEYKLGCRCTTPGCSECAPDCSAGERNRWATVLEALNGRYQGFTCNAEPRVGGVYTGQYDQGYLIPHYRISPTGQLDDGILDVYMDRVKFGLMTFDGQDNFIDYQGDLEETIFQGRLADNRDSMGDFSYGDPKSYFFPGCDAPMMLDNGARNESADVGRMVSVGSDDVPGGHRLVNTEIQMSIGGARPYGPTPIAGLLDDARFYFRTHPDVRQKTDPALPGDAFYQCRDRFAILLTDGLPNADKRGPPHNCDAPGFTCPYDRPSEIAADLCQLNPSSGVCEGDVDGVFVVGFDVGDPAVQTRLDEVAALGGTDKALLANDRDTLMARLAEVLDAAAPGTTTRTVPAFATTGGNGTTQRQLEFNTGFILPQDEREPWSGVLERRRFECVDGSLEPKEQSVEESEDDLFHVELNGQVQRRLLTVLPTDPSYATGYLIGDGSTTLGAPLGATGDPEASVSGAGPGGAPSGCAGPALAAGDIRPDETGLGLSDFDDTIPIQYVDAASGAERNDVVAWVEGAPGSPREDQKLGDIYHSSPAVSGPPALDRADEEFNLFRQDPLVADRPTVVYVGTNDGILHAFVAERTEIVDPSTGSTTTFEAGHELWGFIPPYLLPKLKAAMVSRQWMVDGSPVVKEVFYTRKAQASPNVTGDNFRTVLVVGLRGGGPAYVALDVTNPLEPVFLWQFAHEQMGDAYGQPGVGQALVEVGGSTLEERGIAILPGGTGDDLAGSGPGCGGSGAGCAPTGLGPAGDTVNATGPARSQLGCWSGRGRHLFVLDVASGRGLRHLDDTVFNAPLNGGVSLFTGDVGTVATRAFFSDADGVLWRLDLSTPQVDRWVAEPFHDMFYDQGPEAGMPGYNPPLLSTRNEGEVVVIHGTGDVDILDSLDPNRVVSLSERLSFDPTGAVDAVEAVMNWEIPLDPGEQVTGPMELFDGKVFFTTFRSANDPLNACDFGESYLWGVEYVNAEGGSLLPVPGLESTPGSGVFDLRKLTGFDNQIVMGVAVTQRPTCFDDTITNYSSYFGSSMPMVTGGGQFEMVANVSGNATPTGGGEVGRISREMPPPLAYTAVQSWTGAME